MADETISTRIVANADFSALIADVHKVTASLSKLQEQLAVSNKMLANNISVINRTFADTLRSTGQFSTHFVSLTSDVEKFGKNLDGGKLKLRDYFNTFQTHVKTSGGLIRDLARQQVAMQNAVLQPLGRNAEGLMQFNVHVPRGLDAIKNKTSIARQELAIMNKVIQDGAVQLINWGKNTQWAGRQLTVGLTVPMAAFGKAAADAFKVADQELTRLTKVYGDVAGTSSAELGKVRQDVINTSKELSSAYGTNFAETIGLAADIAATGKQGNELLASVKETSRLAVLGEVDRQEAMKATLAIQSAFKANTEELAQSINFLNAVENQTSTTLQDLVEAIPKAGPVIKGLGGSVQDLALYLTAMREGGVSASEGANALKSALASLINPTDVAVAKFQGFGIDLLGIVNNNAGNVTKTLLELQASLDKLDPLQKQQAIEQLFGKFQFSRLNALFENLGRQGSQTLQVLDLMKASASDLEAVAGRELAAVTESASGKYKRAIESLKADLAGLGDEFLTISTNIINIVDKALEFFGNLPKPIKQALTFLGALTAVAGPLIMLTGVLANFFGYILKGVGHMKAFFKGGEGWKYLTPEMLAAEKAGKLVEQTFYSDAKAAAILQTALRNLIDEFAILEAKAKSGAVSVGPAVSTMAGNLVMGAGGGRVVNPSHPLVGTMGSRASTHMVPRGGMSEEQRLQQTIFGLVPGSIPVNRKIGEAPQIYMSDRLPDVPGLTTIGGTSTGVVAGEAARWHAMTATLAMQSKEEIKKLKTQVMATGVVSKEFMDQFDNMLPAISTITNNAAKESSLIVAELRAGKLTVEQAKAKIIALNLEVEQMIASTATAQATAMGRTLNPTMVPTLNQPVVDPTGKSNMRELFKKSKTRDLIDKVARSLGVRTSGAGYNIETTRPRKFATGVVGAASAFRTLTSKIGGLRSLKKFKTRGTGPERTGRSNRANIEEGAFPYESISRSTSTKASSRNRGWREDELLGMGEPPLGWVVGHLYTSRFRRRFGARDGKGSSPRLTGSQIEQRYDLLGRPLKNVPHDILPSNYMSISEEFNTALSPMSGVPYATGSMFLNMGARPEHLLSLTNHLIKQGYSKQQALLIARRALTRVNNAMTNIGDRIITEEQFGNIVTSASIKELEMLDKTRGSFDAYLRASKPFNMGGVGIQKYEGGVTQVPGYGGGDIIPALIEPGESVVTKTATAGNQGALTLMNAGYNVDNMLGLQKGMVAVQKYRNGIIGEAREKGFFGFGKKGGGVSPLAGIGVGMGLQMAGQQIGGGVGAALQVASVISMIAPSGLGKMLTLIPKIIAGFTSFSKMVNLVKGGLIQLTRAIPGVAVLATVYGLVKAFQNWRKGIAEAKRDAQALNGITEKGAKEAGIQYVTLTDRIKAVKEEQKLAADKAKAFFESYTSAGVGGLTLTIQQLKELKERVKTDMPETLAILNNIDSSQVNQWASNLKAQMVAAGKSVEEANNLIYALIESSNKAGQGISTLTNKAFMGISDKGSAANYIIKNLAENVKNLENIDPAAFASNVDTAISSLDAAVQGLIGTKDSTGNTLDEAEALAVQFQKMADAKVKDNKLGAETLKVLKAQRPELAGILNDSDTIGGMYAKWRLLLQGVSGDLSAISSEQAEILAKFTSGLDAAGKAALDTTSGISGLKVAAEILAELDKRYKNLQKAANQENISRKGLDKAEIKAIQDKIKGIRELADAKKRALRETFDQENAQLELQQAQIDLQAAVARGDAAAQAQAQLRIQQIQKELGLKQAEARIDELARKDEAKQQGILEADQNYKDSLQTAAENASSAADKISAKMQSIKEIADSLSKVIKLKATAVTADDIQRFNMEFSNVLRNIAISASKNPEVFKSYKQFLARTDTGKKDKNNQPIYEYKKDDKGNYMPGSISDLTYELGYGLTSGPGSALTELGKLSQEYTDFALKLMGDDNRSLTDIYNILKDANKPPSGKTVKLTSESDVESLLGISQKNRKSYTPFIMKDGKPTAELSPEVLRRIVEEKKLKKDDIIEGPNGIKYKVTTGEDSRWFPAAAERMAMGGYIRRADSGVSGVMGTQPYLVGERGPELFIPSGGGQIIPNNLLNVNYGPRFNLPRDGNYNMPKGINSSFNNNTYNIDIDLNGTNVTVDDIMRRFKAELALINAKEGRNRLLGGVA